MLFMSESFFVVAVSKNLFLFQTQLGAMLLIFNLFYSSSALQNCSWGTEPIKMSFVREENLMPAFFFMRAREEGGAFKPQTGYKGGQNWAHGEFTPSNNCPDELFDNTMKDLTVPTLPYLEQDDWGCEALTSNASDVPAIIAETDELRAAITPQWGGKVWSLYNKRLKRQMFYNNPVTRVKRH